MGSLPETTLPPRRSKFMRAILAAAGSRRARTIEWKASPLPASPTRTGRGMEL